MSEDLISRQDVIELVKNSYYNLGESIEDTFAMLREVEQLPSVEPERKTGRWIVPKYYPTQFTFTCSKCGYKQSFNGKFKFCPNCGAKMVKK